MKKAALYLILLLQSCMKDGLDYPLYDKHGNDDSCRITVEVENPETKGPTRSSFTDSQLNRITDLNIFIYHNGRLLKEYCRYFTDMSSLMLTLPYAENNFNIYMLGNVDKVDPPAKESDIGRLSYIIEEYEDLRNDGFPVAAAYIGYKKGTHANFKVKRMAGQYNIRMKSSASDAVYTVKDVRLHNCAKDIYPFGKDIRARLTTDTGDRLTSSDLTLLNSGESVTLYFIENLQGILLPDNTDRKKKIPSSIELTQSGLADRCTYIEVTADISTPAARYTGAKYRFYLGENETTDFNIRRNTLHNVTLDFSQNMVNEEEWRIEAGEPEVVGVKIDKTEAMVIKGAEDIVFIQAFDNNGRLMDFNVRSLSSDNYINIEKTDTYYLGRKDLGKALGLRFTSNVDLCGLYPMETEPTYKSATVRISSKETYNGKPVYSQDIKVRIYDKLFPLLIKLDRESEQYGYSIILTGQNPMKLGLTLSSSYKYGRTVTGTQEVTKARYMENQVTHTSTVNKQYKTEFGRLAGSVTASDLTRIDFAVRGFSGEENKVPLYPRLLESDPIHMGQDTKATFGPDESMCPAILPSLADDEKYCMWFDNSGINTSYNTDYESEYGYGTMDNMCEGWITPDNKAIEFPADWESAYFFAHYYGIHPSTRDPESSMYKDYSQYEKAPFYFVNGGLTEYETRFSVPTKIVRYPNKTTRSVEFCFLGCGRDLFRGNTGNLDPYHRMKMSIATWKPMIGSRINTQQQERTYTAQLYMTINGASCWCGNDLSEYGYQTQ